MGKLCVCRFVKIKKKKVDEQVVYKFYIKGLAGCIGREEG